MKIFPQTRKSSSKQVAGLRKLHSVHSLLIGREFIGEIEAAKTRYKFTYAPTSAALADGRIELNGSFNVNVAGRNLRAENVKARLLSTQGSLISAPRVPEGADVSLLGSFPSDGLPVTDATGPRASVGVIYFKLTPMDGRKMSLPFDLNAVQLNGRMNPGDDIAIALQFWFSVAVSAVHGESPDSRLASESLNEINRILKV